mmetsp:Transcript_40552/g.94834  ORF Transcript_40552/g.94834 Transcript_40552/m.94834 type:complete len:245 (+) Transcript_40552:2493-3227(+)
MTLDGNCSRCLPPCPPCPPCPRTSPRRMALDATRMLLTEFVMTAEIAPMSARRAEASSPVVLDDSMRECVNADVLRAISNLNSASATLRDGRVGMDATRSNVVAAAVRSSFVGCAGMMLERLVRRLACTRSATGMSLDNTPLATPPTCCTTAAVSATVVARFMDPARSQSMLPRSGVTTPVGVTMASNVTLTSASAWSKTRHSNCSLLPVNVPTGRRAVTVPNTGAAVRGATAGEVVESTVAQT